MSFAALKQLHARNSIRAVSGTSYRSQVTLNRFKLSEATARQSLLKLLLQDMYASHDANFDEV